MTAYVLFVREGPLTDPASYQAYVQRNSGGPLPANMSVLAANPKVEALEGEAPDTVFMVSFPSVAEAKAWYNGPYNDTIHLRQKAARYRAFIFEGQ